MRDLSLFTPNEFAETLVSTKVRQTAVYVDSTSVRAILLIAMWICFCPAFAKADSVALEKKDGTVIAGEYLGMDKGVVQLKIKDKVEKHPIGEFTISAKKEIARLNRVMKAKSEKAKSDAEKAAIEAKRKKEKAANQLVFPPDWVTLVYERMVFDRRGKDNADGYVHLMSKLLRKVIDQRHFKETKRLLLEEHKLLECDGRYTKNEKALGYRIGKKFVEDSFVPIEITNPVIRKRIKKTERPEKKQRRRLIQQLTTDLKRIQLDDISNTDIARLAKERLEMGKVESWQRANQQYRESLTRLREGHIRCCSDEYGRVHTNVTSLKSEFRNLITIDGKRMFGIDIKNSQPLFLTIYLSTLLSTNKYHHILSYSLMIMESSFPDEVKRFTETVSSGRFYEFLQERLYEDADRDTVKNKFMTFAFDEDRPCAVRRIIREEFPLILQEIQRIKMTNYRNLARMLQREESSFVIDTVCKRLKKEFPEIPLITIHDSILTTEGNENVVRQVMEQEFGNLGVKASLKEEQYDKPETLTGIDSFGESAEGASQMSILTF